jgi:hypothetical protein
MQISGIIYYHFHNALGGRYTRPIRFTRRYHEALDTPTKITHILSQRFSLPGHPYQNLHSSIAQSLIV